MFTGEIEELTQTENAQPALLTHSLALLEVITKRSGLQINELCSAVMGHSLGEFTALGASGALSVCESARLVRARGEAMRWAGQAGHNTSNTSSRSVSWASRGRGIKSGAVRAGAMAALMPATEDLAKHVCQVASSSTGLCVQVANINSPTQVVISGDKSAVEEAVRVAKAGLEGVGRVRRAVLLPVSAPFHCDLMAPAADKLGECLHGLRLGAMRVPIVANATGQVVSPPSCEEEQEALKSLLRRQLTSPVQWVQSIFTCLDAGNRAFVELGAAVLGPLVKQTADVRLAASPDSTEGDVQRRWPVTCVSASDCTSAGELLQLLDSRR